MQKFEDCCISYHEYTPIFTKENIQPCVLTLYKDSTLEIFNYYINENELEHILFQCNNCLQIKQYLTSLNIEYFDYSKHPTQKEYESKNINKNQF